MLKRKEEVTTGPYLCYVTNYDSSFPWPRRYTYRGCNARKDNNFMCAKSIEGDVVGCNHNPLLVGNHQLFFRFSLFLTDANAGGGCPLRATIFDSAQKLVGIGPNEFQAMDSERQSMFLHGITTGNPLVNVWIRTCRPSRANPEGGYIITNLEKVVRLDLEPLVPSSTYVTANGVNNIVNTPRTSASSTIVHTGSPSTRSSMSTADLRRKLHVDEKIAESLVVTLSEFFASMSTKEKVEEK